MLYFHHRIFAQYSLDPTAPEAPPPFCRFIRVTLIALGLAPLIGPLCLWRPYQELFAPHSTAPRVTRTHKPLHIVKVANFGRANRSEAMVLCRKTVDCSLRVRKELLPQGKDFEYFGVSFTGEDKM